APCLRAPARAAVGRGRRRAPRPARRRARLRPRPPGLTTHRAADAHDEVPARSAPAHTPCRRTAMNMDVLVSLAKRRGFIFQSSEIYGGTGSCWDYGPLGVELKNNVKRVWWRDSVQNRADMVGLDASILMHPRVGKASGHLDHFTDPMVDCRACKRRFRADKIDEEVWVHFCEATKGN